MKVLDREPTQPVISEALTERSLLTKVIARLRDYFALTKPRIIVMAVAAVAAGAYVAARGQISGLLLLNTSIGVTLAAAASFVLNQLLEAGVDGQMARTQDRPLPSGRVSAWEVLLFGVGLAAFGLVYLGLMVNPVAALVTAVTFATYVFLYTPLKRYTTWNTVIGAVPGALPPAIGWVAVTGSLDMGALALFSIVFLWQFPHFYAIAWYYRDEYANAGLKMLPAVEQDGDSTCRQMLATGLALIPVSLIPSVLEIAGTAYLVGAVLLGLFYLTATIVFVLGRENRQARALFRVSLIYLPALFLLLGLDLVR